MKRWFLIVALGGAFYSPILSQTDFVQTELRLKILLDSVRKSPNDSSKLANNTRFKNQLEKTLKDVNSFDYPFNTLKTLGTIESPDNQIRIYNWNLEMDDKTQRYFCFVQKIDSRKKSVKLIELKEDLENFNYRTEEVVDGQKWYGALYYQIIPILKNNKTLYTVLGWDGHTDRSSIKLIDIMTITGSTVKLGAPLFKLNDKIKKRVYFEHSEQSTMTCRWENTQQRIVFDHLSPETPTMEGFYEYYVPDMSYDAFEYVGNKWNLIEDIISVNSSSVEVKLHKINEETGDIDTEIIANKWIDPSVSGSTQNTHVAVKPDKEIKSDTKKDSKKTPQSALDRYNEGKKQKALESNIKINKRKRKN